MSTKTNKPILFTPYGGLGEIGLNMFMLEQDGQAIIIDCGVMFPQAVHPGIDLILPPLANVFTENREISGLVLTHGHEDHIGAIPYLLRRKQIPIYATSFTLALLEHKLKEHGLLSGAKLNLVEDAERFDLGPFNIETIPMSHSICDAVALAIRTSEGMIVHTGDFKIDAAPADGRKTHMQRFAELGEEGITVLLSDSTNVEVPGRSQSETTGKEGLQDLLDQTQGWFVVSSFASHIPRLKQVFQLAQENDRKVLLMGRSMRQNVGIARALGKLKFPDNLLVDEFEASAFPRNKILVVSTGSQGEPRSALTRLAMDQFRDVYIEEGDTVVFSSRFIPGNEKSIFSTIDHLYRRGAEVYTNKGADIHVSGHAYKEDLREMLLATKPTFFIPVHGEYRHLVQHLELAREVGVKKNRGFLLEDGQRLSLCGGKMEREESPELDRCMVLDNEITSIANRILKERRRLSFSGTVVPVAVVDRETGELMRDIQMHSAGLSIDPVLSKSMSEAIRFVEKKYDRLVEKGELGQPAEELEILTKRYFKRQMDKRPIVLPVVIEI